MTKIQDDLRAAMLEQESQIARRPSSDLVAGAARRHGRRARRRAAFGTGALGLVAAIAIGTATQAGQAGPTVSATRTVELNAKNVSEQVAIALDSDTQKIRYSDLRTTRGGRVSRLQIWEDDAEGAHRVTGSKGVNGPALDYSASIVGDEVVEISIDHASKTWRESSSSLETTTRASKADCQRSDNIGLEAQGGHCVLTGNAIRQASQNGQPAFLVLGREKVAGKDTLHLQRAGAIREQYGPQDLWVDPNTYQPVRSVQEFSGADGSMTVSTQIDYEFLDRTPDNLALLKAKIPSGYSRSS